MDIIIAVGTAGSGVSALAVWKYDYGKIFWLAFTALAALISIAKPIMQLNKKIERLSKLFAGHSEIYNNMIVLISRIKRRNDLTEDMISSFEMSEQKFLELSKDDDPKPNMRLLGFCEAAIRKRHPSNSAWFPELPKIVDERPSAIDYSI